MKHYFFTHLLLLLFVPLTLFAQQNEVTIQERDRAMDYFIQGISDFENEDFERALDNLTAAHLILSEDPGINYALSDVYFSMGDFSNAAYYGQIAASTDPENKWYHINLANIYRQSGRNSASIEALDKALEYQPNDVDILFMKAGLYTEFGELRKSNQVYDRIIEIRGSEFELHLRKFQNYNALKMTAEALEQLEIMRDLNPGNLSTLHTISQFYLELGDEESARETLLDAKERNQRDPQTLILLAEIFIHNSEWEQLGNTFVSMIEDPLIYPTQKMELVRFLYLQHTQNPNESVLADKAEKAITVFSRSEPEFGPAQLIAAEFFMQRNQLDLALETLERANEVVPEETDAWTQRMQILFTMQRYDEVIELSGTANEMAPNNAFIKFFTGASYMLKNDYESADTWLEDATTAPGRRPIRSLIYSTLGDVKHDLDKWDEAKDAYEMALRLDSENHNAMNNYAYFMSLRMERLPYALELAEKANNLEPGNAAYLDTLGWIYFKQGNYEKAKMYIQESINTGDASAEVYEHLGDVFEALDELESAREWWQKAFELDSDRDYLRERLQ